MLAMVANPVAICKTERARDKGRERESPRLVHLPLETWRRKERTVGLLRKVYAKRAKIRGEQQATPAPTWARFQDWPSGDNEYFD